MRSLPKNFVLLGILLSLGLGKWGAWFGMPSVGIFFIDVIFIISIFKHLVPNHKDLILYFIPCIGYITFELLLGGTGLRINQFRDLIPFVYVALVPSIINALRGVEFRHIVLAVRYGSSIHLAWTFLLTINILKPIVFLPSIFGVQIFERRWDLAGMVYAIGILSWSTFRQANLNRNIYVIVFFLFAGSLQSSRAGIIVTVVALALVIRKENFGQNQKTGHVSKVLLTAILGLISFATLSLLSSYFPNSAVERLGLISDNSKIVNSAGNTARARSLASETIISYTFQKEKQFFGFGPGSEIVLDSGAIIYLSGSKDVRASHNWFVGLFGRFGYFGFCLWFYLVFYIFLGRSTQSEETWLGRGAVLIILIVSSLGVILESPFGALPFSFFLGLIGKSRASNSKLRRSP
jgi:hypothetical protein